MANAPRRLKGQMRIGGQEHFYLESHIAMAIPGEDDEVTVWSPRSTRARSSISSAMCSNMPSNAVTVNVRRMGGGFGGKETQGNQCAALAAIAAKKLKRAVKFRPDRDEDMTATGKRHDFLVDYEVGFDDEGRIHAVDATYARAAASRPTCPARSPTARCSMPIPAISTRMCTSSRSR
jgi:xanthine dehydrogenase large subunit